MPEPKYPSRLLDRIMLRMPDGMRDRLADAARANRRSVNAEVVARLEKSLYASPEAEIEVADFTRRFAGWLVTQGYRIRGGPDDPEHSPRDEVKG